MSDPENDAREYVRGFLSDNEPVEVMDSDGSIARCYSFTTGEILLHYTAERNPDIMRMPPPQTMQKMQGLPGHLANCMPCEKTYQTIRFVLSPEGSIQRG